MPIKLIGTIILLVIVTIFCGFNMENKCDVNFVFYKFQQVPIFLSLLVAFLCGALVMFPFTLGKGKKSKSADEKKQETSAESATTGAAATAKENSDSGVTEKTSSADASSSESTSDKTIFGFKIKKESKK